MVEEKFNAMLRRSALRLGWHEYDREVFDDVVQTVVDNWMITLPLIIDTTDLYYYSVGVGDAYSRVIIRLPLNALIYLDTTLELDTFKLKPGTVELLRRQVELGFSRISGETQEARAKYTEAVRRNEEMKKRILQEVRGS